MERLAIWAPPIVWTAVVLLLSSADFSAEKTGGVLSPLLAWLLPWLTPDHTDLVHGLARKTAHLVAYAILGGLWLRAFTRGGPARPPVAAGLALALSVGCAVVDEIHQAHVPSRTGSVIDVALDAAGATAAVVPAWLGWWRAVSAATTVLLWVAAAGGLIMLGLNLAAGIGGGVLWLTVPAAAALLLYRRRRAGPGLGK